MSQTVETPVAAVTDSRADSVIAAIRNVADAPLPPELRDLRGMNLVGKDLSGLDLSGCDFTGADLSRSNLEKSVCSDAVFTEATLYQARLDGGEFLGASFERANLTECRGQSAGFGRARFSEAKLFGADFSDSTFVSCSARGADFTAARLSDARFLSADLHGVAFVRAEMRGVDLRECNLDRADFGQADLRGAVLRGVRNFQRAHWVETDVREGDFAGAYLVRRHIIDENYLHEFRRQGGASEFTYQVWRMTSNCGRSMTRWGLFLLLIVVLFGVVYAALGDPHIHYRPGLDQTIAPFYFSLVTVTTLGFGDVTPTSLAGQIVVMLQIILGYLGLGGLVSILSNKFARRGE